MSRNIIFYFSGTGNSLNAGKEIGSSLGDYEIIGVGNCNSYTLKGSFDSVGFIYPTYFTGMPIRMYDFVKSLNIKVKENTYFYALTTYAFMSIIALSQLKELLKDKDINLSYGEKLVSYSNYIIVHNMSEKVDEITKKTDDKLQEIIKEIKERKEKKVGRINPLFNFYYNRRIKKVPEFDKKFLVSDACISCNLCRDICPVNNIEMIDGKPSFKNSCELCVSCIQFCPKRAINYKDKTNRRRRYKHPSITARELIENNRSR